MVTAKSTLTTSLLAYRNVPALWLICLICKKMNLSWNRLSKIKLMLICRIIRFRFIIWRMIWELCHSSKNWTWCEKKKTKAALSGTNLLMTSISQCCATTSTKSTEKISKGILDSETSLTFNSMTLGNGSETSSSSTFSASSFHSLCSSLPWKQRFTTSYHS